MKKKVLIYSILKIKNTDMDFIFEARIKTRQIILEQLLLSAEKIDDDIEFYKTIKDEKRKSKCIENKKLVIETADKLRSKILTEMF